MIPPLGAVEDFIIPRAFPLLLFESLQKPCETKVHIPISQIE
jgi:hypothetical protein